MGNPPPAVKLALESICLLLGEQAADWRAIRGVIIKDNFISTVVNFSTEDISYVQQLGFLSFLLLPVASKNQSLDQIFDFGKVFKQRKVLLATFYLNHHYLVHFVNLLI